MKSPNLLASQSPLRWASITGAALLLAACAASTTPPPAAEPPPPAAEPAPAPAPEPAAPPPPPPVVLTPPVPSAAAVKVNHQTEVLFDFDKSDIRPEAAARLDELAQKTKDFNLEVIITIGHACSIGSDDYNQRLSIRRAEAVKAYLASKGIEATRVYTEGKGETQPVADNSTREGRAKNRRVEVEAVGMKQPS